MLTLLEPTQQHYITPAWEPEQQVTPHGLASREGPAGELAGRTAAPLVAVSLRAVLGEHETYKVSEQKSKKISPLAL